MNLLEGLDEALQTQHSAAGEELRITSAKELFEAISGGDMLTRLSVLEAVALEPHGALGLGQDGQADLVGVLGGELETAYSSELRLFVMAALAAMPTDPRVTQKLEQVWFLSDDTNERILAVSRLALEDNPDVRSHLKQALLSDDLERVQAVANVWRTSPEDSPAVRLRVALATEQSDSPVPSLQEHTKLWLSELRGLLAVQVRAALEATQGVVEILTPYWEKLSLESRAWLLQLATRLGSSELPHLTDLAMQDEAMQLEAIQAIQISQASDQYAQRLLELAEHSPEPTVQAAAIQAGAPGDNRFRAVVAKVRTVRVAAIRKLGLHDRETLLELLQDPDWRIRSAAADRLTAFGEASQRWVEPLLEHPRLEVRVAAARVLQG